MPANLTPDYKRAEQAYRAAQDDRERLAQLKEMLRTIPKHKGTEHLQADLKSRIKQLSEELAGPRKGAQRSGPVHVIRREGAAQIALLGPPNSGKSSLHAKLTGSRATIAPYPHATHEPLPGMLAFEDVLFQLVDLPPVTAEFVESWFVSALQPADAALLVVDVSEPDCAGQVQGLLEQLDRRRVTLLAEWPADPGAGRGAAAGESRDPRGSVEHAQGTGDAEETAYGGQTGHREPGGHAGPAHEAGQAQQAERTGEAEQADAAALDPFRIRLPTLLVASKCDLHFDPADLEVLEELVGVAFPAVSTSAVSGRGLGRIGPFLFAALGIVRVYTKAPGKPPDMERPFTVRHGATVLDVARLIHKDLAGSMKYARAWGQGVFDGRQVGPDHPLRDRDIIELHMR